MRRSVRHVGSLAAFALSAAAEAGELPAGVVVSARDGVVYEDVARGLRLDLDGRLAVDWVQYDARNARSSGLRVDRAWLSAAGRLGPHWSGRVSFDLDGIDTRGPLWEAWVAWEPTRLARLSAGLLRVPLGVEALLGEGSQPLPGYPGFVAFLTGRTDWGVRLAGEVRDGLLDYGLTATLGEGFDLFGQRRAGPQLSARLTSYPLRGFDQRLSVGPYEIPLLSGWFAHAAFAWSPDFGGYLDVATPLRNKLFLTSRLEADAHSAFALGYGVDLGPIRVIHELTRGSLKGLRVPAGGRVDLDGQITAWQLMVSWRVTGEPYDSRPFRHRDAWRPTPPARPFDGKGSERGFGSVELTFRYANGDMDRDFFTLGFTDDDQSSQEFRTATAGVNWDPTAWLRLSAEVVRTIADQRPAVFDSHGRDTSGLLRVQLAF